MIALNDNAQALVNSAMRNFMDLYDNDNYGPYLGEISRFNDERYPLILKNAVMDFNSSTISPSEHTIDTFPYTDIIANNALEHAFCVNFIKHLILSYTEQPSVEGSISTAYMKRNDYANLWSTALDSKKDAFKQSMKAYNKRLVQNQGNIVMIGYSSRFAMDTRYRRPIPRQYGYYS